MGPMGGGGSGCEGVFSLVPEDDGIKPGTTVAIEAYVESESDLRAFQVALSVTGGTAGTLTLEDVTIENTRSDFLFNGLSSVEAEDLNNGRAASALFDGGAEATTPQYLAVFTLRASNDAAGSFTVDFRSADTLLRDAARHSCTWDSAAPVVITIKGS